MGTCAAMFTLSRVGLSRAVSVMTLTVLAPTFVAVVPALATPSPSVLAAPSAVVFQRINAIRVSDHLPAGLATSAYGAQVRQALRTGQDPPFVRAVAGIVAEESLWGEVPASGVNPPSPASVVNAWVFHDGWRGSLALTWNADCVSPTAPDCNGHRRAVLSRPPVPGARLYLDVATKNVTINGSPAVAVATLMVWKLP